MLRLTYSNRTERLLQELTEALRQERDTFGPWETLRLVVPNPNVRRYLLDGLGRSLGVLANFQVDYLDSLWSAPLKALDPPVRIWNRHALQGAILSVLEPPGALDAPDLASLKQYLLGEGGDLKLIQVAEKAAGLLEDYTLSRPDWATAWMTGKDVSGAPEGLESWQRGLWTRIVKASATCPVRWATLAQVLHEGTFKTLPLPPRIHVFGLSYVAEVYHRAFEAAAATAEVNLYSLNPCEEYWDDLPAEREVSRGAARRQELAEESDDPFGLEGEGDPLLLRRWGRPGRENVRLLNEISGCDFESVFPQSERRSQLQALQDDLQHRQVSGPLPADESIKLLTCPNAAREAEVTATEIWRLMEAAPVGHPLRFSDIAIVVPPDAALRTTYIDHLRTAFDATGRIPLVVVDAPSPATGLLLDGAELLLDLPLGRGSRRDLLRAMTHPAVLARFPDLEPGSWPAWAEAAGIVRGFGPEDLAAETALEEGLLHWEQGLERLALSAFLPPDGSWSGPGFERPSLAAGGVEATGAFLLHASSLLGSIKSLRNARHTPAEWAERLQDYLLDRLGSEEDVFARRQVTRALERVRELVPEGLAEPRLSYRQARELASQALQGIRGDAGGRPHQGVVVGSYAPMRALPFRAIFLLGLGEGIFPAAEERNPLDLRTHRRRAGDVGSAERDRYLFLEMLLGARESLRLSYPSEDPLSKEARLPSSLVMDLLQALDPDPEDGKAVITTELHPRYRFDPVYFPKEGTPNLGSYAPSAHREALAHTLGETLQASGVLAGPLSLSEVSVPQPWREAMDGLVGQCAAPAQAGIPDVLTVKLTHLRAWLECPVQGTARVRLRLRDEAEDLAGLEEEPMDSSALTRAMMRRSALLQASRKSIRPDEAYRRVRAEAMRSGEAPPGIFGDAEAKEDLDLLQSQFKALEGESIRMVRFGPSMGLMEEAEEVHPPLDLDVDVNGRTVRVRLVGSLQPQVGEQSLFIEKKCGVKTKKSLSETFKVKLLRAYLDHHLLATLDSESREHGALCIAGSDEAGKNSGAFRGWVRFTPLAPEAAIQRLQGWIKEMLETPTPTLLPIEEVLKGTADGPEALRDAILERAADKRDFSSFKTGPLPRAERYPVDPDPSGTAERRLGDFLAQMAKDGELSEVP